MILLNYFLNHNYQKLTFILRGLLLLAVNHNQGMNYIYSNILKI